MIEHTTKDRVFGIISYCDTDEKLMVLVNNIQLIRKRFPSFKVAHQSNYPLSPDIQKMSDMYFYQDLNHIPDNKWIYYWNIIINLKTNLPYFKKKFYYSILDTGYSVFQQIKTITKYLIDYEQVLLINYDTSVEEININEYNINNDLTVHRFPNQEAYSLIIMSYNPKIFYDKVAKFFTYENWIDTKRIDQLNEQRFYNIIHEHNIQHFVHDYKISDKISGEPDYLKPNAPLNNFFDTYLMYVNENNNLEIYLWELKNKIDTIFININYKKTYQLDNQNKMGGFEFTLNLLDNEEIKTVQITQINETIVNIILMIKKGYSTRAI